MKYRKYRRITVQSLLTSTSATMKISPLDKVLQALKIPHILIPPRAPRHNGKVERSHRNDQRYFYNWETFKTLDELNEKLKKHLEWSNSKIMRTLGMKSPVQLLAEKLAA